MVLAVLAAPMFNCRLDISQAAAFDMVREQPKFEQLPTVCTYCGYTLLLVREYPAVGIMPELEIYRCEKCGHIEIIEADAPDEPRAA